MRKEFVIRYPLLFFAIGVLLSLSIAVIIVLASLTNPAPPLEDIFQLILFMASSGILTVALAYMLYRLGLIRWFRSLRWALLVTIVLTVSLVFINVWVTAQLMFIDPHDLALTSALLVFAGLTAITFGVFISRAITDGIFDLVGAAERLARGDLSARLDVKGNDELSGLAETFNWMAGNLQQVDEQKRMLEKTRRDLIAWVSHDLRTPLASMRVMVEAIADGVVDDRVTVERYLRNTQSEIQHLSHLIDDLFELAQLDVGHLQLFFQEASLRDLISDTLGTMKPQADAKQVKLSGSVADGIDLIYMAPEKIQRVLYNLINNAIAYTPSGGEIKLTVKIMGANVLIEVHNTGGAIDSADLPYIFNSFYRGERSRRRNENGERGAGLGLAIARGFIEAHKGKIWVESLPATGTKFSFTIPLKR